MGAARRSRPLRAGCAPAASYSARVSSSQMERLWDARAREDAFWFVDSRLTYGSPDEPAFWSGGEASLERLLAVLGAQIEPEMTVVDLGCGVGRLTRPLAR